MTRVSTAQAVLFADVSESGALYRRLGDDQARATINDCISTMESVLAQHSGELVKTLGDAVLCVFSRADNAVLAASEMQALVSRRVAGGMRVGLHIGIHYGPVLTERADVFGDTVNVAAYLTASAQRDQILTTEAVEAELTSALRHSVRPLFSTVLKGSGRESTVYQVLWRVDDADITEVNGRGQRVLPADRGSLLVACGDTRVRVDQWRSSLRVGRAEECDLIVSYPYASRRHLTIRARRTQFFLIDHSINGTYVTLDGGTETHVLRAELLLDRSGELTLGRPRGEGPAVIVAFNADRRSMFRV